MDQRLELVNLAMQPGANISQLSKRFGVSRRVCYKWIRRFEKDGEKGLNDLSRKPHSSPLQTSLDEEKRIIKLRRKNPEWGARKLKVILGSKLSASTITTILHRNNLIDSQKSEKNKHTQRFEYDKPNELWQMDFKGFFKLLNSARCFPLTILDDHSRFSICLKACSNQQAPTVKDQLTDIFRRYGLPDKILTDNGSPWGTAGHLTTEGEIAYSSLEIWLMRLQIKVIHGRPYHPQTQGKEERFHRTLKTELLQYEQFRDFDHCQRRFDKWRNKYNQERPHCAIGLKTPAALYEHSNKCYPETLPTIEYPQNDIVRKVSVKGVVSYKNHSFKVGKGLINQFVGLRATEIENVKEIYFCNQKIKDIIVNF